MTGWSPVHQLTAHYGLNKFCRRQKTRNIEPSCPKDLFCKTLIQFFSHCQTLVIVKQTLCLKKVKKSIFWALQRWAITSGGKNVSHAEMPHCMFSVGFEWGGGWGLTHVGNFLNLLLTFFFKTIALSFHDDILIVPRSSDQTNFTKWDHRETERIRHPLNYNSLRLKIYFCNFPPRE